MDELDGRAVTERLVRVNSVVMVEPDKQPLHDGSGIRERTDANVVALEGSHGGSGHAVDGGGKSVENAGKINFRIEPMSFAVSTSV